jgi:hypothetical protein
MPVEVLAICLGAGAQMRSWRAPDARSSIEIGQVCAARALRAIGKPFTGLSGHAFAVPRLTGRAPYLDHGSTSVSPNVRRLGQSGTQLSAGTSRRMAATHTEV